MGFKIDKRLCKILSVFVVDKGMIKWVTPLGRVFKIHNVFLHDFIGCLLSVSGMLLWVTPLGVR